MAKRKRKKAPPRKTVHTADRLKAALAKRKKADLVEVIVEIARDDRGILRQLELRFGVEAPPDELIEATRGAISDATDFDEREIGYNFDYDYAAYETVKRNFSRLVKLGHVREAMKLSLELMKQGSYQVEMSDEGMMTDDIEECLQVVIKAVAKSDLPASEVAAWCTAMAKADRIGCHCDGELANLAENAKC